MREARIILPRNDNDGAPLDSIHAALRRTLCVQFGGFTATESRGGWIDDSTDKLHDEPGICYDVAMNGTAENINAMRDIASAIARDARQVCVYVRQADGVVEFALPALA